MSRREGLSEHTAAALCYFLGPITAAFFLTVAPYNRSFIVRFHAWQSIGFVGGFTLLYLFLIALTIALPFIIIGLLMMVLVILGLAFICIYFLLITQTIAERKVALPLIGPIAERLARQNRGFSL